MNKIIFNGAVFRTCYKELVIGDEILYPMLIRNHSALKLALLLRGYIRWKIIEPTEEGRNG